MAVYKLFPSQDATLYKAYPSMNTGLDAILEVKSEVTSSGESPRVARSVIKFDQSEINSVVDNQITGSLNISASLKAYIAKASGIIMDSNLKIYAVSGSWNNGSGQYLDNNIVTNGVSWVYASYSGSREWRTAGFPSNSTGSWVGALNAGGANWFTTASGYAGLNEITGSQNFNLRSTKDLNADVTNIVKMWYSSSKGLNSGLVDQENDGFLLRWGSNEEFNSSPAIQPWLKFYSVDTNTIYPPTLEIKWRDYVYNTGSLEVISTPDLYVSLDNNLGTFYSQSINNFRLNCRPEFPVRTYKTASLYTTNHALPSESYYAIKDLATNEYVVEFDNDFTQISCDATGSYFKVFMNGLEPERNYKILVKTNIAGNTIVLDEDYYFKVVNG